MVEAQAWTCLKAVLVLYRSAECECVCHGRPAGLHAHHMLLVRCHLIVTIYCDRKGVLVGVSKRPPDEHFFTDFVFASFTQAQSIRSSSISLADLQGGLGFSFFKTSFFLISLIYHDDQTISRFSWRICRWRAVNIQDGQM